MSNLTFEDGGQSKEEVEIVPETPAQLNRVMVVSREGATQALQSISYRHFEKTMEKKEKLDAQKKKLWKLFGYFFIFLAILFVGIIQAPHLKCRHAWTAILLLFLAWIMLFVAMSQTLRVINAFKYQRRCHKLTFCLASDKLRALKSITADSVAEADMDVTYQVPTEDYAVKFKNKWIFFTLFLLVLLGATVSSIATLLCT